MPNDIHNQLVNRFKSLNNIKRKEFISNSSTKQINILKEFPDLFLRDDQLINSAARYIIFMCGRSFGKTFLASAWIAKNVRAGIKSLGIVGATFKDLHEVMVPAILHWFGPEDGIKYVNKTITFKRYPETCIYCYSSDATEIRGPNISKLWVDELAKCNEGIPDKIEETFSTLDFAVRIGESQILITGTPQPIPILFKFEDRFLAGDPNVDIRYGTLMDNTALPKSFQEAMLAEYGKSRRGLQEIFGKLLRDTPGAAFSSEMIEHDRITPDIYAAKLTERIKKTSELGYINYYSPVHLIRTIIAVDPSVTDTHEADEVGIIVAALLSDHHVYILEDISGQYTTLEWAQKTSEMYKKYGGTCVIEANQGGELCRKNIQSVNSNIPIKLIRSVQGKLDRAFAASRFYEQHLVHHVGTFTELEQQMTRYNGNENMPSPGRLDSLVFAIQELKLEHVGRRPTINLPQMS
jgi:phage terminase large subunit-like protein